MRDETEDRAAHLAQAAANAESMEELAGRLVATAERAYADAEAAQQRAVLLQSQTRARLRSSAPRSEHLRARGHADRRGQPDPQQLREGGS
ncbi:hypothetical protein ACWED2_29515 [Amycolatopsis sp. NPDC005003]